MRQILKIHPSDNVAVAISDLAAGQAVQADGECIIARSGIASGHKIALKDLSEGESVIKYGFPIGKASMEIRAGDRVSVENLRTAIADRCEYAYAPRFLDAPRPIDRKFEGYLRENGEVGTRNEIWIINTVGCVNRTAERIAEQAQREYEGQVDGIHSFSHPYGCSQLGDDHERTQRILAGLVNHPNAGGVLVIGLGCENNRIEFFREKLGPYNKERVLFMNAQDVCDEVEEGVRLVGRLVGNVKRFRRTPVDLAELRIGLKCGGSDAFSGITANPLLGRCSDILIASGASVVMTEVPEMFGAETVLMGRCANRATFDRVVNLIDSFKQYYVDHGQPVHDNPSPGNKDGGITTLEEKSLGCIQKCGVSPVNGVIEYGHKIDAQGLSLLSGPGNDLVACTALVASGAQLILFTTGRGTPLGSPAPTIKVSSTSSLSGRKPGWIDFDAGRLLHGAGMESLCQELVDRIVQVASGSVLTKSEVNGYRGIAILKDGVYN